MSRTNIEAENTYRLHIVCYAGSGNAKTFSLQNDDGSVLNLSALSNAVVTVEAIMPNGKVFSMNSADSVGVSFIGDVLTIRHGVLELPAGTYYPRVSYTHDGEPLPITIMAKGWTTEIHLKAND